MMSRCAVSCSLSQPRIQHNLPTSRVGFQGNQNSLMLSSKTKSKKNHRSTVQKISAGTVKPGSTILVVGATGGVGQLTTAKLLERGFKVRALCRDEAKAGLVLGNVKGVEFVVGDCRDTDTLRTVADGVDAVVCVTGTTAFPSNRWKNGNGPENTDYFGNVNLVNAVKKSAPNLKRFIFVSSVGVSRTDKMPFLILNLCGVLKFKAMAEKYLKDSGLPYTILRPGRLTDGPYTSFDLNTLLQATSGTKRQVEIAQGETLLPEATSRIVLAEACVQVLGLQETENEEYEIGSTEGPGPESDVAKWEELFSC